MSVPSTRRRTWLLLVLLIAFVWWYRKQSKPTRIQPKWNVVDFKLGPPRADRDAQSIRESTFGSQEKFLKLEEHRQLGNDATNEPELLHQHEISHDELQDKIHNFIQWNRPLTDHWPAWHDYDQAAYDPNRWEALERYVA